MATQIIQRPMPEKLVKQKKRKRKSLRRVSDKRREVNVIYNLAKAEFWLDRESKDGFRRCEWTDMSPKYDRYDEERCHEVATDLHHKKGRTGSNLTNKSTFLGLCRKHHNWIHDHAREARKRRYLL